MRISKRKILIGLFWSVGMVYTGRTLIENYKQFKKYPAMTKISYDATGDTIYTLL